MVSERRGMDGLVEPSRQIPTLSYLNAQGELSPDCTHHIPDEELVRGYTIMVTARYIDERMVTLQRQGLISFALSALGEEAAVVGSVAALHLEDWLYPQYREGASLYWRGGSIQEAIHHMFCNGKDPLLGRQMPNHFGSKALNIVPVSSPIASQIPHAAGCAYGMKLEGTKSVAVAYFGEGATSEGDFHAGLNFAAVRKAPCIFFCRNNGYAISTPAKYQFASDGIAPKGEGYGMPAFRCDGNDYFAVHHTMSQARKICMEQGGPVLVEAMSYRLGAHSTSDDPTAYRTREEEEKWREKCPINRLRLYLEKVALWSGKQEEQLQASLKKEVGEAIQQAKAEGPPPLHTLVEDVYTQVPQHLKEQLEEIQVADSGDA